MLVLEMCLYDMLKSHSIPKDSVLCYAVSKLRFFFVLFTKWKGQYSATERKGTDHIILWGVCKVRKNSLAQQLTMNYQKM